MTTSEPYAEQPTSQADGGGWPAALPVGAVRFARRTTDLQAALRFYRDLVGLPLLLVFEPEDGPDPVGRLRCAGLAPVAQPAYWSANDAVTFHDPDGRALVLAPWVYGVQPPPARNAIAG